MKIWNKKKLGKICEILDNIRKPVTAQDRLAGPYPYYGATGIKDYVNDYIFDEDLVLIGEDGAKWDSGDQTAFKVSGKYWVNNHAHVIRPDRKKIMDDWLIYFIKVSDLSKYITGSTVKKLNQEKLKSIEIPLPSLEEQKEILKKLHELIGKIVEAKSLRVKVLADTEKILSQTLAEILEEGKKKGWEEKKIGDIFTFNYGKGLSKFERSQNGKYIVYGANGELGRTDKFFIEGDSLIIGRKGSAGEVIRVSGRFWPTDVTYFVVENPKYNINFAFYLFKHLQFTKYAKGVKPGINRNEIYSLKFNYPPLLEQKKIVAKLNMLSASISELKELQTGQLRDLKSLENAYLREAFNGELM